jgi:hypothetical protein
MGTRIADAEVRVNNEIWPIVPGSVEFTEGQGEQSIEAASTGGGGVEQIYTYDVTTNFSMVKFDVFPTPQTLKDSKIIKSNRNNNVVELAASTVDGNFTRTFTQAAVLNDPEKKLGVDGTFSMEFKANPAI